MQLLTSSAKRGLRLFPTIRALLQVFLLIVIPLLIVASVVEAYITPLFVSLFL